MAFQDKVELKLGDITQIEVDAIVNAANNDLILGGGVAGAIRRSAGPAVQEECNNIGTIPLGEAAVTGPGQIKAKYIIHAASMSLGSWATESNLRKAIKNSLLRAEEKGVKTLAFPAIGTGVAGFSIDKCAQVMFEIISDYFNGQSAIEKVYLVLYNEKTFNVFQDFYNNLVKNSQNKI